MKRKHKPFGPYEKFIKRPLDLSCGLLALFDFGGACANKTGVSSLVYPGETGKK